MRRMLGFTALALAGVLISFFTPLRQYLTIDAIRELSGKLGIWGPLFLLLFGAFGPLIFLPRWPVCFAGGILYGIVWGSVIGNIAGLLGAWIHYATSRALVSESSGHLLEKLHIDPSMLKNKSAFWILVILRAVPVSNSAMTNVMAGSLNVPTGTFVISSFLGMIPSTVMYAAWGKMMKKPDPVLLAVALGILLAMMLGTIVIRRYVFHKTNGCSRS